MIPSTYPVLWACIPLFTLCSAAEHYNLSNGESQGPLPAQGHWVIRWPSVCQCESQGRSCHAEAHAIVIIGITASCSIGLICITLDYKFQHVISHSEAITRIHRIDYISWDVYTSMSCMCVCTICCTWVCSATTSYKCRWSTSSDLGVVSMAPFLLNSSIHCVTGWLVHWWSF